MKYILLLSFVFMGISCKEKKQLAEEASPKMEQTETDSMANDWIILFDGSSMANWHFYNGGAIGNPWKVEENAMVFYPPKQRPEGASYNIVTNDKFKDFVLSLEWRVSEGGNSGIFWGVHEDEKFGQPYLTGPEIQVLDDERHPDAKNGTTHQAGALYDMLAPSEKVVKPAGEWNTCILTVNHKINEGNVVLNGAEIVKFPVHGPMWNEMVADSKFADWEGFGAYHEGNIGLQDHGDMVSYRNIKIKKL